MSIGVEAVTRLRGRAVDLAYASGWTLSSAVPEGVSRAVFGEIADRTWMRNGEGVQMLESNLARVVPSTIDPDDLTALSREAMRSYMRYWSESFSLPRWSKADVLNRVEVRRTEILDEAIAEGKGMVIALPHSGNWDLVGAWFVMTRGPFATVAERLAPEGLFQRFRAYRESLGMDVLAADGGPRVLASMGRRLRDGGVVCLMADRDLTGSGVRVDFFGEPAHFPAGPAALAASTGARLVTARLHYEPDRLIVSIDRHVEPRAATGSPRAAVVADLTQQIADRFADAIADHPADWHMLQPFWDGDRGLS